MAACFAESDPLDFPSDSFSEEETQRKLLDSLNDWTLRYAYPNRFHG
jgi:hypothetical protein